jgi:predicted secreted acid phosphatase
MKICRLSAGFLVVIASLGTTQARADWTCKTEEQAKHGLDAPIRPNLYNIDQLKALLKDYRYCGEYDQDLAKVLGEAKAYVEQHAHDYPNPAIVLDIDETSLSNWLKISADDFGFVPGGSCTLDSGVACGDMAWELSGLPEAIKPTLELFKTAKNLKVAVFFVTGRFDRRDIRKATIENLNNEGYVGYDGLYMRPTSDVDDVRTYKTSTRHEIQKNFRIIANIGDQKSDLDDGKEADKTFLVPNPFYFIP